MSTSSAARRTTSRVPWSELGLGTAAITTSAYLYDTYSNDMIMRRLLRAGIAVGQIGYWYKFESPETAEASSARHRKAARKMAEVCGKNEGLFVKFGQALSTLNHILPPEYTEELAVLLTDAPPVAFCHIRETIEEEINTPSFRQQYVTTIATSVGISSPGALLKMGTSRASERATTSSPSSNDHEKVDSGDGSATATADEAVKKETWKEQYRRKQEEPSTLSNVASFMTSSPVEVAKSTALPTLIASSRSDDQTTKSSSSSGAETPHQNQAAQDAAALLTILNLNNGERSATSGRLSSPKESSKEASEKSVERALKKIKTGQRLTAEDVFEWIEEEPIATASIAQVHRAVVNVPIPANRSSVFNFSSKTDEHGIHNAVVGNGRFSGSREAQENEEGDVLSSPMRQLYRPVAVKVLKPQIKRQMHWDLWIHEKMLSFTESQFGLPLEWAKETIRHNTLRECDFGSEARVLRRVEAMLLQRHCALENGVKYCRKTLASPSTSTTPTVGATPGDDVSGQGERGQGGDHGMPDSSHQPTEGRSRRVPVTTPVPKAMPDVTVPSVVDHLSSDRMLVTDWVDGLKMTDTKKVTDAGFHPGNFLTAMYEAYADLVFHDGIVHADPHAGNVFVRWVPKTPLAAEYASSPFQLFASLEAAKSFFKDSAFGADQGSLSKTSAMGEKRKDMKQQIVLLDWGLYDEASPDFRRKYAQLFECALTHDMEGVKAVMSSWNCGNTDIMASLLIQKPMAGDIKAMKKRLSREEIKEMHTRVHSNIVSIFESASKVPRELIHITRGMNHLRSLNKPFGLPVNRVQVFADRAVLALDDAASWSWSQLAWWYVIRAAAWLGFVMGKRKSSEEEGTASLVQGETQ